MNKEIQEYLETNNVTISFTKNGKIEVNYNYGQLGKVESYDSFEQMFNWIKFDAHKQTQKLELEISGRQTGKTSRLIDAMVKHIEAGGICFLYCSSQDMGRNIRERMIVNNAIGNSYNVYVNPTESTFLKLSEDDLRRVRYFFDEFDFLKKDHQLYHPTGYYCTTPSKLRDIADYFQFLEWKNFEHVQDGVYLHNDLLMKLIIRTNFNFERRMNYDLVKRFGNYYPKEKLRMESGEIFR